MDNENLKLESSLEKIKAYMQLTTDLILEEQESLLSEMERMENILYEASAELRGSFTAIDDLVAKDLAMRSVDDSAEGKAGVEAIEKKLAEQYRRSITALQFEDIVKQIIGHSIIRSKGIDNILRKISTRLIKLDAQDLVEEDLQQTIEATRIDIKKFREKMATSNPVAQKSLDTGDIELF